MNLRLFSGILSVVLVLLVASARAEVRTVATFHSASLYWTVAGGGDSARAYATFSRTGETAGQTSLDLVYDSTRHEYCGSLLNLTAGSTYSVTLYLNGAATESATVQTWSESFPVARTVQVKTGRQAEPLKIKNVNG